MNGWSVRLLGRHIAFTRKDEDDFFQRLRGRFPGARILVDDRTIATQKKVLIEMALLNAVPTDHTLPLEIIFDPKWEPRWRVSKETGEWSRDTLPYPNARMDRCELYSRSKRWSNLSPGFDPSRISDGMLYFRCRNEVPGDMKLARAALRLVGKVASNKGQVICEYPSMRVLFERKKGEILWLGNDARRWLLERPDRMAGYFYPERLGHRPEESLGPL